MLAVAGVSFVAGLVFLIAGAWPVTGLFGLDVAADLLGLPRQLPCRRAYEQIVMTPTELDVPQGQRARRGDRMALQSAVGAARPRSCMRNSACRACIWSRAGNGAAIAGFLGAGRKGELRQRLQAAFAAARRGPDRTAGADSMTVRNRSIRIMPGQESGGSGLAGSLYWTPDEVTRTTRHAMLSPDRVRDDTRRRRRRLRRGATRHRPYPRQLARAARHRHHRRSGESHARPNCIICSAAGPG